jgi:uncharacterized protein (DUF488 family)
VKRKIIYTIGHSTHSAEEFIDLLKTYEIEMVLDVRTIPKSKFNPQYNMESLILILQEASINYMHLPKLGGLRHTTKDSINTGWQNPSFRGFADYMQTPQFQEGLEELEKIARKYNSVIMCAEALPWRCHRTLIADALTLSHWKVLHIMNKKSTKLHELTDFLHVKKGKTIYLA